jgi:hypothetical protein
MPYPATVHNVFIASPGDVRPERQVARQVISAWNAVHSKAEGAILEALGWDTHAYPEMGGQLSGLGGFAAEVIEAFLGTFPEARKLVDDEKRATISAHRSLLRNATA